MAAGSWIQDPKTGKLIERSKYYRADDDLPWIQGDIETFRSPIDGTIVSGRRGLREHNLRNGVTDTRDYSPEFIANASRKREQRLLGQTPEAKRGRINDILRAMHAYGG